MLDLDRVCAMFALFTDLPDDALPRWAGLREAAARRLAARLRPDVDLAAEMEALCIAAAALAYADFLLLAGTGAGASGEIRVGDISLRESEGQTRADADEIRAYFLESVAHLLEPAAPALLATPMEAPA